uniref:Uncharacterized protein n=1 Tax=Spironucleus salmonicida TaxID=348837 RepID=V6LJB4_9EUKA|eukprot:EST44458.1 Hypothetical protein SS50377_15767 [Spironucleus salmonicida]
MTLIQSNITSSQQTGMYSISDSIHSQIVEHSIMCKTYGDIEFQYSSMQTDSDMRPYVGEPFQQPSTIIITKCVTGAYLQCDLSNIKKILVKCSLPSNHLIVNIPSLRHLELVNTKLQIIDAFHAQKLVSLKIKDPLELNPRRLVSLPKALDVALHRHPGRYDLPRHREAADRLPVPFERPVLLQSSVAHRRHLLRPQEAEVRSGCWVGSRGHHPRGSAAAAIQPADPVSAPPALPQTGRAGGKPPRRGLDRQQLQRRCDQAQPAGGTEVARYETAVVPEGTVEPDVPADDGVHLVHFRQQYY